MSMAAVINTRSSINAGEELHQSEVIGRVSDVNGDVIAVGN